jgi:hypothetical protein
VISVSDTVSGITYRSFGEEQTRLTRNSNARISASLVTGAHSLKAGFQSQWTSGYIGAVSNPQGIDYTFANGVPTSVTLRADPTETTSYTREFGLFLQDRWTYKRLTLTGGLRLDTYTSYFPAATLGPIPLAPTRTISFPETDGVNWKDVTTRMGAAYDLFGNGRTAVKVSLNKYMNSLATVGGVTSTFAMGLNPANRIVTSTTRSWNDANKNFTPDCVLTQITANGECGALANTAFGLPVTNTNYDPAILNGWGFRPYNWEFGSSVQQQIADRLSVDVGYFRRSYGNFTVTDNLSVAPSDFSAFSITAPVDGRLPGGGGQTIAGLYNVSAAKFGQTNSFVTLASNYGNMVQRWQGVDMNASVRAWRGLTFSGGFSTGSTLTDACDVRAQLPELVLAAPFSVGPTNPYCNNTTVYLTQVKGLGTYRVPKVDVQISAGIQSIPGPVVAANFNATNAFTQASLGRPLSGNASNVSVNLVEPGKVYGDRVNQVDMRFGKTFRFGQSRRVSANLDVYNIFNRGPVVTQNDNFATTTTTWTQPQAVLPARLVKVSAQFDF